MTDETAKDIAEALLGIANAIGHLADNVDKLSGSREAENLCLGEWIANGLAGAADDIIKKGLVINVYGPPDGSGIQVHITTDQPDDLRNNLKPL